MIFSAHRINTINELKQTPSHMGIEIDLRDKGTDIILSHDPFSDGELLSEFVKEYNKNFTILNIKSERIEHKTLEIINNKIKDYFFLDCSFPMIYKLSKEGNNNIAVRFSEFESIESVLRLKEMVKWIWVDCFTQMPLNIYNFNIFKEYGFKVCIVSPELQLQPEKITVYRDYLIDNNIVPDMVCSKIQNYNIWKPLCS